MASPPAPWGRLCTAAASAALALKAYTRRSRVSSTERGGHAWEQRSSRPGFPWTSVLLEQPLPAVKVLRALEPAPSPVRPAALGCSALAVQVNAHLHSMIREGVGRGSFLANGDFWRVLGVLVGGSLEGLSFLLDMAAVGAPCRSHPSLAVSRLELCEFLWWAAPATKRLPLTLSKSTWQDGVTLTKDAKPLARGTVSLTTLFSILGR